MGSWLEKIRQTRPSGSTPTSLCQARLRQRQPCQAILSSCPRWCSRAIVVSRTHGPDDNRASKASGGKNANPGTPKRILEPCD